MLLGIFLHAAVLCEDRSAVAHSVFTVIHSFRLHGFFLLAGFFCALSLTRDTAQTFIRKRAIRLGVPLVSCSLITLALNTANHQRWSDFDPEIHVAFWSSGAWLQHLWFLPTLLFFAFGLACAVKLYPNIPAILSRPISGVIALTLLGVSNFFLVKLDKIWPLSLWGNQLFLIQLSPTFHFLTYFLAGYVFFHHTRIIDQFVSRWRLSVLCVLSFYFFSTGLEGTVSRYITQLFEPAFVLAVCSLIIALYQQFRPFQTNLVSSLVASSYTVYLLHWPIQVTVHRWLDRISPTPLSEFVSLSCVGLLLPLFCHKFIIERFRLCRFLLNGFSALPAQDQARPDTVAEPQAANGKPIPVR